MPESVVMLVKENNLKVIWSSLEFLKHDNQVLSLQFLTRGDYHSPVATIECMHCTFLQTATLLVLYISHLTH